MAQYVALSSASNSGLAAPRLPAIQDRLSERIIDGVGRSAPARPGAPPHCSGCLFSVDCVSPRRAGCAGGI